MIEMVHLDLRPANIFLTSIHEYIDYTLNNNKLSLNQIIDGILCHNYYIQIGDFGHCCNINDSLNIIIEGEINYCPKELIESNGPFDLIKCDIFSFGITIYELSLGKSLNKTKSNNENEIQNKKQKFENQNNDRNQIDNEIEIENEDNTENENTEWHKIRDGILLNEFYENYSNEFVTLIKQVS